MTFKNITTFIVFTLSLFLIGCGTTTYPEPENSLRSRLSGAAFGVGLALEDKTRTPIEFREEPLSAELKDYIIKNVPGYVKNRYLGQLEQSVEIRWIDFKKGKTKVFFAPFDEKYKYIGSVLVSPDGKFIAMNITQGFESYWSKLIIIDTENNNYAVPLTDEVLLKPAGDSPCTEMTVVEVRTAENANNQCIVEAPASTYMIDWWSTDSTVELIKRYPSGTILYSLEVN